MDVNAVGPLCETITPDVVAGTTWGTMSWIRDLAKYGDNPHMDHAATLRDIAKGIDSMIQRLNEQADATKANSKEA